MFIDVMFICIKHFIFITFTGGTFKRSSVSDSELMERLNKICLNVNGKYFVKPLGDTIFDNRRRAVLELFKQRDQVHTSEIQTLMRANSKSDCTISSAQLHATLAPFAVLEKDSGMWCLRQT